MNADNPSPRHALLLMGLFVLLGATGCLSSAHHLGAATTPKGHTDLGVSLNGLLYERGREPAFAPSPEFTFRKGAGENWDWGGRFTLVGVELGTRHRLVKTTAWAFSLAPIVGVQYVPYTNNGTELVNIRLGGSALVDWMVSPRVTLTAGASLYGAVAGPLTTFQGRPEGTHWLTEPTGLVGVAFGLTKSLELRAQGGVGVPFALDEGRRPFTAHGGFNLRWRR